MIKLLIFDLDGTLADTSQDITNALNYALKPVGQKNFSVDETKAMVGSGISNLLHSLVPDNEPDATRTLVVERFISYYSVHLLDNTTPYPSVKETLKKLGHFKMAVLSNKRELYSRKVLDGIGILEHFDTVYGSDSTPAKKPSPIPILKLLEKYNLTSEEAIMIGDSIYDIKAARAAGIKVVGVTYGFRSRESLKRANYIVDSFDQLMNLIPQI